VRRREFIAFIGGAAVWPAVVRSQEKDQPRQIGVLIDLAETDPEGQLRISAFRRGMGDLGWSENRNIHIESKWLRESGERQLIVGELLALKPDVILAGNTSALRALRPATNGVPIVFVQVNDPVADGFVESLARPGGNITGFALFEFGTAAKWVEMLKQVAPQTICIGVLYESTSSGRGFLSPIKNALSPSMQFMPCLVSSSTEIEDAINQVGEDRNGALIVLGGPLTALHRDLIVLLAARQRLPTVSPYRYFAAAGGLLSYGPDTVDQYRVAAGYVDRILKGEKPADLPVQYPTKYTLVINLKAAKALRLEVPTTLLALADEVIERSGGSSLRLSAGPRRLGRSQRGRNSRRCQ